MGQIYAYSFDVKSPKGLEKGSVENLYLPFIIEKTKYISHAKYH
tara:strand:- start:360 stop:491 length:132 start_codon:yes stop_codon:yes gene_type:complete